MADIVIPIRGSREDLRKALRDLPAVLAGRLPDRGGVAQSLLLAVGTTLLTKVSENFERQSDGEAGVFGVWPPLALATLLARRAVTTPAARERTAKQFAGLGLAAKVRMAATARTLANALASDEGRKVRQQALGLLRLQAKAGTLSKTRLKEAERRLSGGMSADKTAALALAMAQAKMLRDTGRTMMSLSPQITSADQIKRTGPGFVEVGSNVTTFKYHNSPLPRRLKKDGTPRLPRRQVLPDPGEMPEEWTAAVRQTVTDVVRTRAFWQQYLGG